MGACQLKVVRIPGLDPTPRDRRSLGIDEVDACDPEVRGGGEQVAIVRVDMSEAVFGSRSQMNGVGSTQEDRLGQLPVRCRYKPVNPHCEREPVPHVPLNVSVEMLENCLELVAIEGAFA